LHLVNLCIVKTCGAGFGCYCFGLFAGQIMGGGFNASKPYGEAVGGCGLVVHGAGLLLSENPKAGGKNGGYTKSDYGTKPDNFPLLAALLGGFKF
jgi:hypothetical protein